MKKLKSIAILLVFFIGTLAFIQCDNENNNLVEENRIKASDLEFVGKEHNRILEETFERIKETRKEDFKNFGRDLQKDFVMLEETMTSLIKSDDKYSKEEKEQGLKGLKWSFEENFINKRGASSLENIENVSEKVIEYLNKLDLILSNINVTEGTKNSFISEIESLEKLVEEDNLIDEEGKIIIFSGTQTAKYSVVFWRDNIADIIDSTLHSQNSARGRMHCSCCTCNKPAEFNKTVGEIAKADATGAVGGAVSAVAANAVVGPGTVAYGTAIVTGAAGNSAKAIAEKVWGWFSGN